MGLGEKIRELRLMRRLTQGQLAVKAGIDPAYVSDLESGRKVRHPSARVFIKLAAALRVDPNELFAAAGYFEQPAAQPSGIVRVEQEVVELQRRLSILGDILREQVAGEITVSGTIKTGICEMTSGVIIDRIALPSAYVALGVTDDSLESVGIHQDDIVIVDLNNRNPANGQVAVVRLKTSEEILVKWLKEDDRVHLEPLNAKHRPMAVSDIEIVGIVTMSLRKLN